MGFKNPEAEDDRDTGKEDAEGEEPEGVLFCPPRIDERFENHRYSLLHSFIRFSQGLYKMKIEKEGDGRV